MALLEVSNLRVHLQTPAGPADAVRGISFQLERGETLGLVGESGCGKSMTAMALMGLLPEDLEQQVMSKIKKATPGEEPKEPPTAPQAPAR